MRSGGGRTRNGGGILGGQGCGFPWIALLLISNDFMLVMLMLLAVRVKMMMMVSLMVPMVTSMGSPFGFSLANLPVFPKQQYVANTLGGW